MPSSNRPREQIAVEILEFTMGPRRRKSQIMQHAGLTSRQAKEYLSFLIANDLIKKQRLEHERGFIYRTTPKGVLFLQIWDSIRDLFTTTKDTSGRMKMKQAMPD
jgi:predicted transcriptional regulator